MADGRMLAKKISLNEAVASLDNDMHRLLFTWGLSHLDIAGRISGSPKVFRAIVVPLLDHITPEKVSKFFKDASDKGLIVRYQIGKDWFIEYPKFKDNQRLRPDREAPSKLPAPPDLSLNTPGELPEYSGETGEYSGLKFKLSLREDKLIETIASPESPDGANGDARPVFLCPSFEIDKTYFDKLLSEYPALTEPILSRELNKMGDWLTDNPKKHKRTARGHIKNPKMFIRNWIERMDIKPGGDKAWYE